MSRLIVVSNRVPLPDKNGDPPAGGLAVALHAALSAHGGVWMGWSGISRDEHESAEIKITRQGNIAYALLDLTQRDIDEYYTGFANGMLWPLCHDRIDLIDYSRSDMSGYFRVNRLFAKALSQFIQPDDIIWVHDYHMIPLAAELRQLGINNSIGFFMHIPWPSPEIFFALPAYEIILRCLAAYDLVGFQTQPDTDNFARCLERENIGGLISGNQFTAYQHNFKAGAFPIGIDTGEFSDLAEKNLETPAIKRMQNSLGTKHLIIGVDRLDYSKGLIHRIDAYQHFIENHPEYSAQVTYLQVTPKSRNTVPEYRNMQKRVARHVGETNGDYGTMDWTPIRYVNQFISRGKLAGLYRLSKVGLVTPLKDGMNLVAKEYIAAQDPLDPGVLILSRFAGAAQELDGALLVNPHDRDSVARTIHQALTMPRELRIERWQPMMEHLQQSTVYSWCRDFLEQLAPNS